MKQRLKIFLSLAILLVLGSVLYIVFRPKTPEPSYGGKTLSEWVVEYNWTLITRGGDQAADNAIRNIGTNAIPILFEWIQNQPEIRPPKKTIIGVTVGRFLPPPRNDMRSLAPYFFFVLGPQAKPAIPQLNQWMLSHPDPKVVQRAVSSLGYIGRNSGQDVAPLLVVALTNEQSSVRLAAVNAIGLMKTNALPIFPELIQALGDPDQEVARTAIMIIGGAGFDPELVVPALSDMLKSPKALVRCNAASALGMFGTNAQPAVPALLSAYNSTNGTGWFFAQGLISNVLLQIDPEALKRATQP